MDAIDDRSVQEKVLQRIRDAILDGKFAPGAPLRIDALAAELKVSHMPVREALHVLTVEGLVVRLPRRGVVVSGLSRDDLVCAYEAQEVIEGLGARKAVGRLSAGDIAALRSLIERSRALAKAGDFGAILTLNRAFHDRIYGASPNRWRDEFYRQLCNYVYRLRRCYPQRPTRVQQTIREHQALLDALVAGDADTAERIVREHCRRSRDDLLSQLPASGSDQRPDVGLKPTAKRRRPKRKHR